MNYILQPLNARAKLKIAKTAYEQNFQEAVLVAQIDFEDINLNINRNQYADLLDLLEFEDYLNMKTKYIKYHKILNDTQYKNASLRRWKFAYTVILNEQVRPHLASFKWENVKENLNRHKEYHELYFQQLINHSSKPDKRTQELEKQIDAFNLLYIRRTAQIEYTKKKIEEKDTSWWEKLNNWWYSNSNENNPEFTLNDSASLEERNKLYEAIGYKDKESTEPLIYPEEYIDMDISLRLNLIEINVWSSIHVDDSHFKVIARASVPNTELTFQRRPAKDDILFIVDLDSLEMVGINSDTNENGELNLSRPVLLQPFNQPQLKQHKFLHLEFESNPLNQNCDYRIHGSTQSLQINYHATTINKLIDCFLPDRHHDLEGIKAAAYSIFQDMNERTKFLLSESLKKIKDLDINIELQSIYVIVPEYGYYTDSSSMICLDLGHLIFKGGQTNIESQPQKDIFYDAKSTIDDGNDADYIPIKIQLENIQLLYLNKEENWNELRLKQDSPSHLIKPITLTLDFFKSIHIDDTKIPIWKGNAEVSVIESHISDTRLFGLLNVIYTIPTPEIGQRDEKEVELNLLLKNKEHPPSTKHTYETIEKMTPVKKILYEQIEEEEKQIELIKSNSPDQIVQLKFKFYISKIDILFQRALTDLSDDTEDFLRILLLSIHISAKKKLYDIEMNANLQDLLIIHEQFQRKDNEKLYLFSCDKNKKLLNINCLLTSATNPLFSSSPYYSIENNIQFELNSILLNIQLEALISIIQYTNNITNKLNHLSNQQIKQQQQKIIPAPSQNEPSSSSSFKIDFHLEEICIIIGNNNSQILYIQLKNLTSYLSQTNIKILFHLILNDFRIVDLYPKSHYQYIISKENFSNDFIILDLSLFTNQKKSSNKDQQHSFIKGHLEKLNIIFLYKHLQLILSIINSFQIQNNNYQISEPSSNQSNSLLSTLQIYQEESLEFHMNFILNLPRIIIPMNSYSNKAISVDLGKLAMYTDESNTSDVEQHRIIFENVHADRIILDDINQCIEKINLLECASFFTLIKRNLNSDINEQISIKIQWDKIEFKLGKDDYAFLMKIFEENFQELSFYKMPQINPVEQSNENKIILPNKQAVVTKNIYKIIQLDFQMKQIDFTFYLSQTNIYDNHISRDENSKFLYLTIQMIELNFQQLSDSSYNGQLQIQHLLLDDLRQKNISRLIDINENVDKNIPLIIATIQSKQNNYESIQTVNCKMESFYVCISPDLLNSTMDFMNYNISPPEQTGYRPSVSNDLQLNIPFPAKSISKYCQSNQHDKPSTPTINYQRSSAHSILSNAQTNVNIIVKPFQIVLLEDQNKENSNCLVLDLLLEIHMISVGDNTNISASIKNFSFYGSNFQQLKHSKVKYSILSPSQIHADIMMTLEEQKIDVNIGDLSINIDPALIKTFAKLSSSIKKQPQNSKDEKERINSKIIFDPKPFKDSNFWFIEDSETKHEIIEETDILEIATGSPSHKANDIKQKKQEKNIEQKENLCQQLTINLNIVEIKLELGKGSSTRPVAAACLSNIYASIENWSTNILVSSVIQIELALFNDHLLAWEPLIEPIIDERGIVQCPWTISCETLEDQHDENDEKCRFLLEDEKSSPKGDGMSLNIKKVISIRADHLLNLTLTKTSLDLSQRLQTMFNDAYKNNSSSDTVEEQAMLTILNQTGYNIKLDQIVGVQFTDDDNNSDEKSFKLKNKETLRLTIPAERLSATHLPAIAEQVAKRKQQFQVHISEKDLIIDINQTWRRVYEISDSLIPNWPIQILCDSHLYEERRRVILSSIIKVSNRTLMPLIILDADSIETNKFNRIIKIDVNKEYYLPIQLLYLRATPRLCFAIQEDDSDGEINDFISFDWANESSADRVLKLNDGRQAHYVVYKEEIEAYSENTDEPTRKSFNIYVKLALHLINLLPIPIQCSIDNIESTQLKPSELYHSTQGNKKSILIFTIPLYNNSSWTSEPIDLNVKGHGIHNEHIIKFNNNSTNEFLRMVLRVDTYRQSYRTSLYSPYWIVNATDLKFEFKIEHDKTFIDTVDQPYFGCPRKFDSESTKKKGHIRLYSIEEDENVSQWSEGFSVGVIKSTGMTACTVHNDRTYMVCIDIVTCSFGMTKIITLTPSTAIINNSSVDVQITEDISEIEDNWKLVQSNQILPYWPRYIQAGVMYVRYNDNTTTSSWFSIKDKHRTLLRMNDQERPALHVEVTINDFDGYKVIFSDYKNGDAPILIVNSLIDQSIAFCQKEDLRTQVLPAQYYVYYTWNDPFKPRELVVSSNQQNITVQLNPACGVLDKESDEPVYYAIFHDGPQTVLMFSRDTSIIESVSYEPSMSESINEYIQIAFRDIGISIVNDITRDDLFYITINQTKDIWTETKNFSLKPLPEKINHQLDHQYKKYQKEHEDKQAENRYELDKNRYVSFNENNAEISDDEGNIVRIKRETLDGLWIGYAWSTSNMAVHLRVNQLQIDNQLQITMFPTILYPIVSKAAGTNIPGKPFIELSVFKNESIRSNTIHIKYFKLLIQEFFICIDQGLILAIMAFVKPAKNPAAPTIDMDLDLKRIDKPLETILKGETNKGLQETQIYFDNLHLSPLKIHVSFSMHGAKPSEQLLAEHPLVDFLLQMLNVAEVEDVVLKLNFYERKNDRYSIERLTKEIGDHYQNQFLKQLHVVVLGLDVLGNPFGVIRGVAHGVESFFYEPYKGAMEGPIEFIEGIAIGTRYLLGSVVGGTAGAFAKVTGVTSKALATLTLDKDYQNARIQRKELQSPTTPELISGGKNTFKDIVRGVTGVVKKPIRGAKLDGRKGFVKGLGKGFLGLVGRPASSVADLTSTSFKLIKKVAAHEEVIHRIRHPRHIGRDGIVRPSTAHEMLGCYIFDKLDDEKHGLTEKYIAHIDCPGHVPGWLFATTRRVLFLTEKSPSSSIYIIDWHHHYKDIKGTPTVKFNPNHIEFMLREMHHLGIPRRNSLYMVVIPYDNVAEARYIVDKITDTMKALEV
ncbi:unnamed protein product [Adineta steineri]|uniref:Uncharacterized protein n=2 Tax=Adineta steineri TaxID=433720 RepID=A0A814LL95_9BILA|nr:unnamed protein product [Adineta steineri]